jgi:hypothetical protein
VRASARTKASRWSEAALQICAMVEWQLGVIKFGFSAPAIRPVPGLSPLESCPVTSIDPKQPLANVG